MHTIGVRYRRNDCLPATGQRRYNDDDALSLSLSCIIRGFIYRWSFDQLSLR